MTFKDLRNFVRAVEKRFGRKALKMRLEVQHSEEHRGEVFWIPQELSYLGIATHPEDEENKEETVVVLR